MHSWRRRFEQEGMPGLLDRSRRPRNSPTRLSAEVEAEICELRRRHPGGVPAGSPTTCPAANWTTPPGRRTCTPACTSAPAARQLRRYDPTGC
ncbi:helix-turn-helix domain-containing protein [Streptomyces sp900129855]|uniref:Helix-turn-helix domain-containing protein n=1 Tax=Streptomyces sp. 900129855 TaxID=3155129 RepID=A0ABV2ZN44_9ACTN